MRDLMAELKELRLHGQRLGRTGVPRRSLDGVVEMAARTSTSTGAIRPGSIFNRQGGSVFNQRQQIVEPQQKINLSRLKKICYRSKNLTRYM